MHVVIAAIVHDARALSRVPSISNSCWTNHSLSTKGGNPGVSEGEGLSKEEILMS
jgi:hypothetical protein